MGRPLWEWGYRTPRFPRGLKGSDLSGTNPDVQRETMIVWFLANHVPAEGAYFGFDEAPPTGALNTALLNTTPFNGRIQVVGFDQGPFFNGGTAADLLKAEFSDSVREAALSEVADLFEGLWQPLPGDDAVVRLENQTPEERRTSLVAALDDFAETVRKLPPEHGGVGHNGPPEDLPAITKEEKEIILRATAETSGAVLSSDYSRASLAWETISPIIKKVGNAIAKQVDNLCSKFTSTLGVTLGAASGLAVTAYIGYELGFWSKAEAITTMLELAKHLAH